MKQPRMRFGTSVSLCLAACTVAILSAPMPAEAQVSQTPKNGCTSPEPYTGSLTSPQFPPSEVQGTVTFQGWFEVESVNPDGHDLAVVEWSADGSNWTPIDQLITSAPPNSGGADDRPYSNNGTGLAPSFQPYANDSNGVPLFPLPAEAQRIRFRFDTVDALFNGFRGMAVDDVRILRNDVDVLPPEGFEGSTRWTLDPASGPGAPSWRILNNPHTISVKNPEVNPDLVTLSDSGALPPTPFGTHVAWFGNEASGTFCGPDFASREIIQPPPDTTPPETAIDTGPPAFSEDRTATFSFSSSEPGSRFECSLDDGPFVPCSSPYTTPRLRGGRHTLAVRAIDAAGNVDPTPTVYVFEVALQLAELPPPTLGRDVNVEAVSGTVLVALPGGAASRGAGARASQRGLNYVPLEEARQIPVGSYLDTKRGKVRLVSARGSGSKTQSGTFSQGIFQVRQTRKGRNRGLTDLRLKGGNFRRCRRGASARGGASAARQLSKRTIRRLRANAKGKFRGSARNSVGTTRGTLWVTIDRCDGTLTKVIRGKLSVRDLRRKRTITLRAGRSYLARARR
jgi:hypothetical protein